MEMVKGRHGAVDRQNIGYKELPLDRTLINSKTMEFCSRSLWEHRRIELAISNQKVPYSQAEFSVLNSNIIGSWLVWGSRNRLSTGNRVSLYQVSDHMNVDGNDIHHRIGAVLRSVCKRSLGGRKKGLL